MKGLARSGPDACPVQIRVQSCPALPGLLQQLYHSRYGDIDAGHDTNFLPLEILANVGLFSEHEFELGVQYFHCLKGLCNKLAVNFQWGNSLMISPLVLDELLESLHAGQVLGVIYTRRHHFLYVNPVR